MTPDSKSIPTRNVLYIQDDPGFMEAVRMVVRRSIEGIEVVGALDGISGLHLAATINPELILLDNTLLPNMDSLDVLHHLKRDPALCRIPVIMWTNNLGSEYRARCVELGVDDFIVRPWMITSNMLVDKVSKFLGLTD